LLQNLFEKNKDLENIDFLDYSHSTDCEHEIADIIDCYHRRSAITLCYEAIDAYFSEDGNRGGECTSNLVDGLTRLASRRGDVCRLCDLLPAEFERQERIVKTGKAADVETGLVDLDRNLCIVKSDYIIIGARPSNCKSTLAGLIGRNVAKTGKPVLVFYLDTDKGQEVSRALFTEAGVSLNDFNQGFNAAKNMPKLAAAAEVIFGLPYYIDDTPGITPQIITAKCQRLKHELGDLGVVIIDFIQNVHCDIKGSPREKINHISSELHDLPKKIKCPVIALSQMSRYEGEESNPPQLYNLKESGNLEQDADKVLLLYWPERYGESKNEKDKNLLKVSIAKNKNGPVSYVKLTFLKDTATITNRIDEPENVPEYYQNNF
jgi:replicative DNA helicase